MSFPGFVFDGAAVFDLMLGALFVGLIVGAVAGMVQPGRG